MSRRIGNARPSPRSKSPSRIPLPATAAASASSQRKRPMAVLASGGSRSCATTSPGGGGETTSSSSTKTPPAPLTGFRRLQLLAKADAQTRNQGGIGGQSQNNSASSRNNITTTTTPWVDKHLPKSLDELFVHKKKVEEVANWLSRVFNSPSARVAKICVLNGPAGCGKTATIQLTAKSMDAEVKEWLNPMTLTQYRPGSYYEGGGDEIQVRTQLELFTDFIFRTSQYRSLPIKGKIMKKHRLTIVEDLPNVLYRDPGVFHEVLRKYARDGISPLVFVFTDTASSEHGLFKMFPKSLMIDLNINNISFNPVASSLMVKFLLDICTKESKPVNKQMVEDIAATANGDLRCAVNNLQFALTKERSVIPRSSSSSTFRKPTAAKGRSRKQDTGESAAISEVQQKDDTIQLFRALGKVLYAKRDETVVNGTELGLEGNMAEHRRLHPLIEEPDSICDKVGVSSDTFLNFLHQNYVSFYGSLDDMRNAAEYLSVADFIVNGWKFDDSGSKAFKVREIKEEVGMNVAVRGLMHSNNNRISAGWKPLTKPLVSNLDNLLRDSIKSTREALFHFGELQTTLFTETIPFNAKLVRNNPSLQIAGRKEILEKGLFQMKSTRAVNLDEKETVEDGSEGGESSEDNGQPEDNYKSTQEVGSESNLITNLNTNTNETAEEEFEIEEYED